MLDKKTSQALATKRKLERVASAMFAERGYADVSAEELVAAAGVTRGALYHHYDGKDGLFAAVVEAQMQQLHERLLSAAAGGADPLMGLRSGVGAFLKVCSDPAAQKILLIDAPAVLGWTRWREMDAKYGLGLLKRALSAAFAARGLSDGEVEMRAHVLLGALTEAAMVIARSPRPAKARKDAEHVIASILEGWRREGER